MSNKNIGITIDTTVALSEEELEIKAELELSIEEGLSSLERLAADLMEYRDLRLWRGEYRSWEECVQEKWSLKRSRIQQILSGAETASIVKQLDIPEEYKRPSEGQLRPISKKNLSPEIKKEVYLAAVEKSQNEGVPLTGAIISKALREITQPEGGLSQEDVPTLKTTNVADQQGCSEEEFEKLRESCFEALDVLKFHLDGVFSHYNLLCSLQLKNAKSNDFSLILVKDMDSLGNCIDSVNNGRLLVEKMIERL